MISAGGFNIYTNAYYGLTCKSSSSNKCETNWVTIFSIGNKK